MVGTLTQRDLLMGLCQFKASRSTETNRRALSAGGRLTLPEGSLKLRYLEDRIQNYFIS